MLRNPQSQQAIVEESGKKIKNYLYHYHNLIGQGNFAKVYRANNLNNSNPLTKQTKS